MKALVDTKLVGEPPDKIDRVHRKIDHVFEAVDHTSGPLPRPEVFDRYPQEAQGAMIDRMNAESKYRRDKGESLVVNAKANADKLRAEAAQIRAMGEAHAKNLNSKTALNYGVGAGVTIAILVACFATVVDPSLVPHLVTIIVSVVGGGVIFSGVKAYENIKKGGKETSSLVKHQ